MPIYEYVCNDCGYAFERMQSFSDDPLTTCPECQGTVRRVITSVGVIFKGSGWYITDSRRQISGSAKSRGSASSSGATEGSTTDAKTSEAGDGASGSGDADKAKPKDGGSTSKPDAKAGKGSGANGKSGS